MKLANSTNVRVEAGILGPVEVWKSKDEFIARERTSLERWNTLADDERAAVLEVVDRALDRLKDSLDEWVPTALQIESGRYLDVAFRILFSELEEEIRVKEEVTKRQIKEAAENTERMVKEMEGGAA